MAGARPQIALAAVPGGEDAVWQLVGESENAPICRAGFYLPPDMAGKKPALRSSPTAC